MPGPVQVTSHPADSGDIHYSNITAQTSKVQEEGPVSLHFVRVVQRRKESLQCYTSKQQEGVARNVTPSACASLERPGLTWLPRKASCHNTCSRDSELYSQQYQLFPGNSGLGCLPPVCFASSEEPGEGSRRVCRVHKQIVGAKEVSEA